MARSLAAVWHPCTQMKAHERFPLVPVERAQGPWLYDFEGRRFLDGVSSWWVNLFGHGHPAIDAALRDQLGKLSHVMLAGFTHAPVIELSERLAKLAPGGWATLSSPPTAPAPPRSRSRWRSTTGRTAGSAARTASWRWRAATTAKRSARSP